MTPRTKARQTDARAKGQTRKLATFLHALTYSDLGTAEVGTAKRLLLDYVGYATASAGERPSEILRALAGELGGRSEATVIGSRLRTNCLWASLINGCMGHMTELDDTHLGTSSHLGDGVFPAALAMGERCRADGKTVLAAVVAGYECGLRAGYSVMRGHYDKGWHPSGTLNAFAAAATAGKILGLDREAFLHTLGLAGTQAAGNFAHLAIRGMAKDLNPGKGAFNGVLSALLAKEGFTGSLDIFENPKGFIRLYSDSPHPERLVRRLGKPFLIGEVAQKIYPGCYHAHSAREATLKLVGRHCLEPDHIRLITVRIFATGASLVDDPVPWKGGKGLHGPRFSAQFQVALAACEGEEGLWSSYDERFLIDKLADRKIRRMMRKIRMIHDRDLDALWPKATPAVVEIEVASGERFSERVLLPKGEPQNPLTKQETERKFDLCAERVFSRRQRAAIKASADKFEVLEDVSTFTRLLRAQRKVSRIDASRRGGAR